MKFHLLTLFLLLGLLVAGLRRAGGPGQCPGCRPRRGHDH